MNSTPQDESAPRRARPKTLVKLVAAGCLLAVAAAGIALAATPKPGAVLTGTAKGGSDAPAYDLTFKVKSEHSVQKVIAIRQGAKTAPKGDCLAPDNFSFKRIHVDDDGSFKDHSVGYMYKATLEGKFKSPTKATGTVSACTAGLKFTVK